MKKYLVIAVIVVLAVSGAVIWYLVHIHKDCSFSGWKQTIGVDIDVAVGDVQAIKSKVGITDDQVREFDALMKDFALKYDAACQDTNQGRMNNAEYLCRRNNMDKALTMIRIFLEKVEAAKALPDPTTQRDVVLKALDDLETATSSGYGAGCTSSMVVDPRDLKFNDHTSERAIQITNSGNNLLIFTAGTLPNGFVAQPKTGAIAPGNLAVVAIYRTFEPVTAGKPLTFHVSNNFQDEIPVTINLDTQNAELYEGLANETLNAAASKNQQPSLQDALTVVDRSFETSGSPTSNDRESMRYLIAAGVLSRLGNAQQAQQALDIATTKNPSLAKESSAVLLHGVVLGQEGHSDQALERFAEAKQLAPKNDEGTRDLSDLLSGAVVLKTDKKAATEILRQPNVQASVRENPKALYFAAHQLKVKNLDKAARIAAK
jgi:tetratricopeptide (TPR) repeat protein